MDIVFKLSEFHSILNVLNLNFVCKTDEIIVIKLLDYLLNVEN